jgi:hypothetical protein
MNWLVPMNNLNQCEQLPALDRRPIGIKAYAHEVSGAYVFRLPRHSFTPLALAGVGALVFGPKDFAGASTQTRAAFVYGAGADFNPSQRV